MPRQTFSMIPRLTLGIFLTGLLASPTHPAERDTPTKGPLAGLPSKPGPHVARIKRLADHGWLSLGAPAPDKKWGKARGRSWTAKMPFAPDLGGAFLFGH